MTLKKSLLYVALIFTSCQLYGQSKKEQLLAMEQRNDSLQTLILSRQKELQLLQQEQAQQVELKRKIDVASKQLSKDLTQVEEQLAVKKSTEQASKESLALLKQLILTENPGSDSLGNFFVPIENVSYRNEQITVLQYDKEKSVLTYVSGNLSEKAYDLSSWTYINSDDIEFQKNKLKQACSCEVLLPTLYNIMKLSQVSIPEEIIQNGVIYTSEGTLYLDTSITFTMSFKSFDPGKPKNKSAYVFFLKTIQL
jgi:acetolactate synthase small subunit